MGEPDVRATAPEHGARGKHGAGKGGILGRDGGGHGL